MKKIRIPILAVLILLLSNIDASAGESRTIATALAIIGPVPHSCGLFHMPIIFPVVQGYGQMYNGQYLKGVAFLFGAMASGSLSVSSDSDLIRMLAKGALWGGYIFSIIDANLAAKEVPQQKLKSGPSRIHSAPPQILVGSYSIRF